jgi:plasmid stabilization system protein ParE
LSRNLTIAPAALRDLAGVRDWLRQPGAGIIARRKLQNIRAAIRVLKQMPCLWAYGDHPDIREIPVEGYRVLYEVKPDTGHSQTAGDVVVLRVFGPGQDRRAII